MRQTFVKKCPIDFLLVKNEKKKKQNQTVYVFLNAKEDEKLCEENIL